MKEAEKRIGETGARLTQPRVSVLEVLMQANQAMSQSEIYEKVSAQSTVNRVTVYRVLDWLTHSGLAHSITGQDRAKRYQASLLQSNHQHAHFKCDQCGRVLCLDNVKLKLPAKIPENYTVEAIELNLRGRCADCQPAVSE